MATKPTTSLVLLDIRSVHNVGAIFRTADAIGIDMIYLVGTTPAPTDRFGRVRADIHKAALGAEQSVSWQQVTSGKALLQKLKKNGAEIVAIEQSPRAIDYKKFKISKTKDTVFVVGTEVSGIPPATLRLCDYVLEIPMRGSKESLNVTTALGIVLFRILDR